MKFSNIICMHLNRFKSIEDVIKTLAEHNMQDIEANDIMNLKNDGYSKVFIDKTTHYLIATVHSSSKKKMELSSDFLKFLNNMQSIDWTRPKTSLSIDLILDKISEKGIDSLSPLEKEFLKNN